MSIVERALRRLQNSGQGQPRGGAVLREPKQVRAQPVATPAARRSAGRGSAGGARVP